MQVKATQKFIVMSPRKLRQVVPMIKNLKPIEAVEVLPLVGKRAAYPLEKVIKTAIANAKQKGVSEGELVIKEIQIGEGPRLKRWRAGARGRAKPYKKKMSHIRVILETGKPQLKHPKTKQKGTKKKKVTDKKIKRLSSIRGLKKLRGIGGNRVKGIENIDKGKSIRKKSERQIKKRETRQKVQPK